MRECNGEIEFSELDLFSSADFFACPGLFTAFVEALNDGTIGQFMSDLNDEAFADAATITANTLITGNPSGSVVFNCTGGTDLLQISYSTGSCTTYCIGRDNINNPDVPLVIQESNCGEVCCKSIRSYCYDSSIDDLVVKESVESVAGLAQCEGSIVSIFDCPNSETIDWQFTLQCFPLERCGQ